MPQFIEEESKIVSFLTTKQFVYLVVAGAIIFLLYSVLPFSLFIIVALIIGGGTAGLAFYKVDGMPVLNIILNSIGFMRGSKAYTWKKKESLYPFKTIQKASLKPMADEKKLGMGQSSGLKKLRTQVELKTK
ncbi:MAG: PrgI family protein [Candidatus Berkelbacteria bacterium]|nr:PrgI family protein [Candidatus Berkelbacteria bacterium]